MAKTDIPEGLLYAFWRYDQFPFVLGGEVVSIDDCGWVKATGYGESSFKPVLILPGTAGGVLRAELEQITKAKNQKTKEMEESWMRQVNGLFKDTAFK